MAMDVGNPEMRIEHIQQPIQEEYTHGFVPEKIGSAGENERTAGDDPIIGEAVSEEEVAVLQLAPFKRVRSVVAANQSHTRF